MTTLISLSCNHCGAPIAVPKSSRFVTCGHCNSRLKIQSSGSASYTEVLEVMEQLNERSEDMAEDLEAIRVHKDIEKLDREWNSDKEHFMLTDEDGHKHMPSSAGSFVGGVIAIIVGIAWMGFTSSMSNAGIFPLFGLVFIIVAVIGMINGSNKSRLYQSSKQQYQRQRRQLEKRLHNRD